MDKKELALIWIILVELQQGRNARLKHAKQITKENPHLLTGRGKDHYKKKDYEVMIRRLLKETSPRT